MYNPIFFANFTSQANLGRTTGTKRFDKLKDCVSFMADKYGYIIRQDDNGNAIKKYCNGFIPSAQESLRITAILQCTHTH
tara:strand:+ start:382 stop:621 length:240 start_codon:yes stop_codon:yes gene_type:complete